MFSNKIKKKDPQQTLICTPTILWIYYHNPMGQIKTTIISTFNKITYYAFESKKQNQKDRD